MTDDRDALAAALLHAAARRAQLLQSIVEVARSIFDATAASIALLDEAAGDFRFEAVAGRGAEIVGMRFPAGAGLAGTAAQTGEPMIVDDLRADRRFARDVAEGTGYTPDAMMVAPLLRDEETLGVLSVLDRGRTGRSALQELQLLVHFADQATIALDVTAAAGDAAAALRAAPGAGPMARVVARLAALPADRHAAVERLLAAVEELLDAGEPDG